MPLVFAAMTPHPPMLIPAIGKDQLPKIEKTKVAMLQLEQDLYLSKPQVIVIVSPHGSLFGNAFSVNAHTSFKTLFEHFGDLATKLEWQGAPELAARLSAAAKEYNIPVQLVSQESIDHGASVPLYYLTNHLPDIKILPIGYSGLPTDAHIRYGEVLKDVLMQEDRRIAVIASGDLSHASDVDLDEDEKNKRRSFDTELIKLLEMKNVAGVVGMDAEGILAANECGYRSMLVILGILKNMDFTFRTYSYEAPFGVGYLVGNFVL